MPSGEKTSRMARSAWPLKVNRTFPEAMSHRSMVLSSMAVARVFPSGEKARESKVEVGALRLWVALPVAKSTNLMVLLAAATKATVFPSGEKTGLPTQACVLGG